MKTEAQDAVDELFNEKLIPFKLTAYMVRPEGHGVYTVHFLDSKFKALSVFWNSGESFKNTIRTAILKKSQKSPELFHSSFVFLS